jgi:hypothetical protein
MAEKDIVTWLKEQDAASEIADADLQMLVKADDSVEKAAGSLYAKSGVNTDITSMTGLDNDGIPLAKVANAASDGNNSDISQMTGLDDNGIPVNKVASATETGRGSVERGTSAEVLAGKDDTRYAAIDDLKLIYQNLDLDVRDFPHDDGAGNITFSTMAHIPKFVTSGWPQAALNGLEVGGFWLDVYKNSHPDATSIARGTATPDTPGAIASTSRPGVTVWDDISWISARIAASNRVINGRNCHLVTPFERFAIMSWIVRSGNWGNVRGNNNNGKDFRDAAIWGNYGTFDPLQAEYRTLTGSGPASWWSGGIAGRGIHGLVGTVYEWEDLRLESGIFQPKAYLEGVATASDTYIDYDDNAGGDGVNICQLTPGVYTIADDGTHGTEDVTVERVIITGRFSGRLILSAGLSSDHDDNTEIQLKTAVDLCQDDAARWQAIGKLLEDATGKYMALPDYSDTETHAATLLDEWFMYDSGDSRVLMRAGHWNDTTRAWTGLVVRTDPGPTYTYYLVGFRSALSVGNL